MTLSKVYSVPTCKIKSGERENYAEEHEVSELAHLLEEDHGYQYWIDPEKQYIFYGDIDKKKDGRFITWITFREAFILFMNEYYGIKLTDSSFAYTKNVVKEGSYHFSIPELNCKAEKMGDIMEKFKIENNELSEYIDTYIYHHHWWRLPNQTIEERPDPHQVVTGKLIDQVIDNISETSENIDDIESEEPEEMQIIIEEEEEKKPEVKEESEKKEYEFTYEEKLTLTRKMFDKCYSKKRFDDHKDWFAISCALKNEFNQKDFSELAVYMSKFSPRYKSKNFKEKNEEVWKKIKKVDNGKGYTFGTLRHYAKIDNPKEYANIFANFFSIGLDLTHKGVAKYLKEFFPDKFIWNKDRLYAFNGRFWESDKKATILMRYCIAEDLYNILWDIQITKKHKIEEELKFAEKIEAKKLEQQLDIIAESLYGKKGLKKMFGDNPFKNNVVAETQLYFGNDDVKFDSKWWLLGFNNCVLDLTTHEFREYKYDDYISLTVCYDWKEPTEEELEFLMRIFRMIQPIPENLECLLRSLSTSLEGRVLLYFLILNGKGQNGKTLITQLLLCALWDLAITGNNLFLLNREKWEQIQN